MAAVLAPASRATALRQSKFLLRKTQFRTASSAAETASKAKDAASEQVSKASEGLSRVTSSAGSTISSAGSTISNYASSAQNALGRVGGRTGRVIKFVESLIPPTVYYGRVAMELGRLMAQHQKMTPPNIATFQSYFQPLTNALRNPRNISSSLPSASPGTLNSLRNPNGEQLTTIAVVFAQVLGFFTVGEMIGRLKIVGYHGEPHHEH